MEKRELGVVVGDVMRVLGTVQSFYDDPMSVGSDCGGLVACHAVRSAHNIVKAAGFPSYDAFLNECESRTSSRWLYFAGLALAAE